jgi:hypothetical protein
MGIMCRNASLSSMIINLKFLPISYVDEGGGGSPPKFLFKHAVKCALHGLLLTCSFLLLNFVNIMLSYFFNTP